MEKSVAEHTVRTLPCGAHNPVCFCLASPPRLTQQCLEAHMPKAPSPPHTHTLISPVLVPTARWAPLGEKVTARAGTPMLTLA